MMRADTGLGAARPFVKWAGGKRLLLPQLLDLLPPLENGQRYLEPCLGGGAVFFGLSPRSAVLADLNAELIEAYEAVRDEVDQIIAALLPLTNDEACFYAVRAARPATRHERAARFIYLNKTCFNGLYRVNLRGQFNVPFGRHDSSLLVCDEEQLRTASEALQNATLSVSDFGRTVARARRGDLVYLDPPYTTAHTNNGFIEYNAKIFSWADQRRLAAAAKRLVERGVNVAISNGDHPSITELYSDPGFVVHRISRWSTMAGNKSFRAPTSELLIVGSAASV